MSVPQVLLVLTHSRTGSTFRLADAVVEGVQSAIRELSVDERSGSEPAGEGGGAHIGGGGVGDGGGVGGGLDGGLGDGDAHGDAGAGDGDGDGGGAEGAALTIRRLDVVDAGLEDLMAASGVVFCTPARFGALAGLTKDLLERIYPWFEEVPDVRPGMPWTAVVKGATDPSGAVRDLERILTGLRWKQVLPPVEVVGDITEADLAAAADVGATMAAGLLTDIW